MVAQGDKVLNRKIFYNISLYSLSLCILCDTLAFFADNLSVSLLIYFGHQAIGINNIC